MDWDTQVAKWTHEGKVWRANETALQAAVLAVPTTTAAWALYNGEPKGGKWYIVLASYAIQGANGATLSQWGLVHQVSDRAQGTAEPTDDLVTAAVVVNQKGNQGVYNGAAVISLALAVLDDRWSPIGPTAAIVVASLSGSQLYVPHTPPSMIPPGSIHSLEMVASHTAITGRMGDLWAEVTEEELKDIGIL